MDAGVTGQAQGKLRLIHRLLDTIKNNATWFAHSSGERIEADTSKDWVRTQERMRSASSQLQATIYDNLSVSRISERPVVKKKGAPAPDTIIIYRRGVDIPLRNCYGQLLENEDDV